jgi:phosphoenolpyruvate carboxykinase (diphosphate)
MEKPPANRAWRLVGTVAEGTLCHKPCTVSGGGKSEISKPITDAILTGPVFVADFKKDFDQVAELITAIIPDRFRDPARGRTSAHSQPGTLARLGHQAAHARRARLHARIQRLAGTPFRNTSRNWSSS